MRIAAFSFKMNGKYRIFHLIRPRYLVVIKFLPTFAAIIRLKVSMLLLYK